MDLKNTTGIIEDRDRVKRKAEKETRRQRMPSGSENLVHVTL